MPKTKPNWRPPWQRRRRDRIADRSTTTTRLVRNPAVDSATVKCVKDTSDILVAGRQSSQVKNGSSYYIVCIFFFYFFNSPLTSRHENTVTLRLPVLGNITPAILCIKPKIVIFLVFYNSLRAKRMGNPSRFLIWIPLKCKTPTSRYGEFHWLYRCTRNPLITDVLCSAIPDNKTITGLCTLGWFYFSRAVILVGHNDVIS